MTQAIALAWQLLQLGQAAGAIIPGIVRAVQGHDARAQRAILDAALAAAENEQLRQMQKRGPR